MRSSGASLAPEVSPRAVVVGAGVADARDTGGCVSLGFGVRATRSAGVGWGTGSEELWRADLIWPEVLLNFVEKKHGSSG